MPKSARLLVDWSCEPTISLFDPPTYVRASLGGLTTSFDNRRAAGAVRVSNAAGLDATGQDIQ
jgi:hypothetical protein